MTNYKIELVANKVEVDESDVITITEAAKLRGVTHNVIVTMLNAGRLPWIQQSATIAPNVVQRFTLRSAVLALPQKRGVG